MQLWLGFILLVVFTAIEEQILYFVDFLQVLMHFLYQVVLCLSQIYLTDISKIRKTCHRAHILNSYLQLNCCTQHILLQCMGSLIHQCYASGHWCYKLETNPNNALHYKPKIALSTGNVLTVIFNLLLTEI